MMMGTTSSTHHPKINRRSKTPFGFSQFGFVFWPSDIQIGFNRTNLYADPHNSINLFTQPEGLSSFGRQYHSFKMRIHAALISFALAVSVAALAHPDLSAPTVTPARLMARNERSR
jgi:hypothetical protein